MKSFQSKKVLVTGASSGIGEAFSNQLAEAGANLVLVARSEDQLQKLSQDLQQKFSIECHVIALDLSKENAAKELFEKTNSMNLEIDVLGK